MGEKIGRSTVLLSKKIYIVDGYSIVGTKEGQGPLKDLFDKTLSDDLYDCNSWEEAESRLQQDAVQGVLEKTSYVSDSIDYIFAGDLLAQSIASSFGLSSFMIPHFGLYGACSTCGEALSLGAMSIDGACATNVICVTSSHFASAEKEFRYPLEYGNQRPKSSTWTVTGSGAFVLSENSKQGLKGLIRGFTTGVVIDSGIKDSMNMGACMAPAAAAVILQNFKDLQVDEKYYDRIITGDLGEVGKTILLKLMSEKGYDISSQYLDCGIMIFDSEKQETQSGGSGCGCSATVLSAYILEKLSAGEWNRVLFIPTGALLSKTSFNEGKSIPAIAHGVILEHASQE